MVSWPVKINLFLCANAAIAQFTYHLEEHKEGSLVVNRLVRSNYWGNSRPEAKIEQANQDLLSTSDKILSMEFASPKFYKVKIRKFN